MADRSLRLLLLFGVTAFVGSGSGPIQAQAQTRSDQRGCRVFLVPGAFGAGSGGAGWFISSAQYFSEYREYFEKKGCTVKTGEFPPDASIEERALVLRDQVERFIQTRGAPVWLVAHSQGALDARFALKSLRLQGVSALASVGAPQSGTPLADWVVSHRERGSWLYWGLRALASYDLRELRFAAQLRADFLDQHRDQFAAVPEVRYASARAVCRTACARSIRWLQKLAGIGEGDGLIPVESQRFGEDLGEYDLDHLSEVSDDAAKRQVRRKLMDAIWEFF